MQVNEITHPNYDKRVKLWERYRDTAEGGEQFLEKYLVKRYKEDPREFEIRKSMSYIPAFSKAALNQARNSVRQRLVEVTRLGGSRSYQQAVQGVVPPGVDRNHSSMNKFVGGPILDELTAMGGVGVYVDAPMKSQGDTLYDDIDKIPYVYIYPVESIRSWTLDPKDPAVFKKLLLRDYEPVIDPEFGLTIDFVENYRYYQMTEDNRVEVSFYDENGNQINYDGEPVPTTYIIDIPKIPFVYAQLSDSLLADICGYQIALLNLGSGDMKTAWEGLTIFLAEKYDPNSVDNFFKNVAEDPNVAPTSATPRVPEDRYIGTNRGIRVPTNVDYPEYISPPAAPLEASMAKQETLKNQIQELLNQNLRTISSRSSSSTIHATNERREEDGLKAIGDELEHTERIIADFWAMYEGSKPAEIYYPRSYEFKTDEDRRREAQELSGLILLTPSKTAQQALATRVVLTLLGDDITREEEIAIRAEIKKAEALVTDPVLMAKLVENDIISPKTAAIQLGFPKEVAEEANRARIERATQIALAQSEANKVVSSDAGARGVRELSVNPAQDAKDEKNDD
jgi:hypothetical protein